MVIEFSPITNVINGLLPEGTTVMDITFTDFGSLLAFLLVAFIIWMAFRPDGKDSIFLNAMACPVCVVYGLRLAAAETIYTSLWVSGVVIAIIGTGCFIKAVMNSLKPVIRK